MLEPTPNITKIPAPRVPILDQRTGLISREWFRFLNNIYVITGGGNQGVVQIENGGTGASTAAQARLNLGVGSVNRVQGQGNVNGITLTGDVTDEGFLTLGGVLQGIILDTQTEGTLSLDDRVVGNLDVATRATGVLPVANGGTGLSARLLVATKTADFTVANTEGWLINNKSGSTCTVTLPTAADWSGRQLVFKNIQAQTLVSASSDVVPLNGGAAGTAILPASVGAWATLVSDGTNWVIMQS